MERYDNVIMISQYYRNPGKKENVNYADKDACLTAENKQKTFVFRRCDLSMPFFIKLFY